MQQQKLSDGVAREGILKLLSDSGFALFGTLDMGREGDHDLRA
jgi:hypothetical protein